MEEISITIHIAGRQYRIKSDEKEREIIKDAADRINDLLRLYSEHYGHRDYQDLMAMVAVQQTIGLLKCGIELNMASEGIDRQIEIMKEFLSEDDNQQHVL